MKKIMLIVMLIISISVINFVSPAEVPEDVSTVTLQKIDAEHQATRQFITNELTKRETTFLDEVTKRGDYYETSIADLISGAVWKLGFLWVGIMILFISLSKIIGNRTELKKYQVLKTALERDIIADFRQKNVEIPTQYDEYRMKPEQPQPQPIKSTKNVKEKKRWFWKSKKKDVVVEPVNKPINILDSDKESALASLMKTIDKNQVAPEKISVMDKLKQRGV